MKTAHDPQPSRPVGRMADRSPWIAASVGPSRQTDLPCITEGIEQTEEIPDDSK